MNNIQNFDCKFPSPLIMLHVSHMERKSSTSLSGLKEQGQTFHGSDLLFLLLLLLLFRMLMLMMIIPTLFVVLNTKLSFTNTVRRAVIIIELSGHQKLRIWNCPFSTSYLTYYIEGMEQLFYSNIRITVRG